MKRLREPLRRPMSFLELQNAFKLPTRRCIHQLRPFRPRHHPLTSSLPRRPASTSSNAAASASSWGRSASLISYTALAAFALGFNYFYITDARAGIHQYVVVPALRWICEDAEEAHEAGNKALKTLWQFGLHPRERGNPDKDSKLGVEVFGHVLSNPIGTSAGIDKHAAIPDALFALGPAVVEIGGITPSAQEGNPKPRVFRLSSQNALVNRYGLNSEGADIIAMRLRDRVRQFAYSIGLGLGEGAEREVLDGRAGVPPGSLTPGKLLAVQVAKNKTTPDEDIEAVKADYVYCVDRLARYADIIVVNVSSPNTPGLRTLQRVKPLTDILTAVVGAAQNADRPSKPAVMVKVSPDEDSAEQVAGICHAIWQSQVDGVIVGNTTKQRPDPSPRGYRLSDKEAKIIVEQGGYSGPQTFERTLALIKRYRHLLDQGPEQQKQGSDKGSSKGQALSSERKFIFASGGITNGYQALQALGAGASVAMVYTALVYGGVGTIGKIKRDMRKALGDSE